MSLSFVLVADEELNDLWFFLSSAREGLDSNGQALPHCQGQRQTVAGPKIEASVGTLNSCVYSFTDSLVFMAHAFEWLGQLFTRQSSFFCSGRG